MKVTFPRMGERKTKKPKTRSMENFRMRSKTHKTTQKTEMEKRTTRMRMATTKCRMASQYFLVD